MRKAYSRFMQARGHRSHLSLLGALLYALCAIALPSLHLGFHRADHEHRHGGLQLLHPGLGGHHALTLPHSHGTNPYNEDSDEGQEQAAGTFASPEAGSQNSLCSAGLKRVPWSFAIRENGNHGTHPGSALLGAEERAPQGSPAPEPTHGSGSLVHFASALVTAPSSVGLPQAGLLDDKLQYIPRSECAPRSPVISAKHARGPPAPVESI